MAFFACDESGCREYGFADDALRDANVCIKYAREFCDPEWPSSVDLICVYEAPAGCEYPVDDGKLLYQATEFNISDSEDGDGYFCD